MCVFVKCCEQKKIIYINAACIIKKVFIIVFPYKILMNVYV